MSDISKLAHDDLMLRLAKLLANERAAMVEFLKHLGEFDHRGLFLQLGYPSLFEYCQRHLHIPGGSAYRRIVAARLIRRFPQIADFLRDGRLSLTTLVLLKDVLGERDPDEVLAAAAHRSKEEVIALLAGWQAHRLETPVLRALKVLVSSDFMAELEQVKMALSHKFPKGDFESVVREGFRLILRARASKRVGSAQRLVPAAVRRDVWRRDKGCCQWNSEDGTLCGSRYQLHYDHIVPVCRGGESTVDNVRLLCKRHNQLYAKLVLGESFMARFASSSGSA
jgi:hypothetical protein